MPKFSIIVLNWNGKHFLETCLSSLRRQAFTDFETILVDNGSHDGSVEFVREHFPEVRLVALHENIGFAAGNAEGLAVARGEWIVLLNNDTEVTEGWLQALHVADVAPEIGCLVCKMVYFDERSKIDNCGFHLAVSGATLEVGRDGCSELFCEEMAVFGGCGGAVAYRRSMLDRIGFLDRDFFMTYEDTDLAFRAQLAGYQCMFVPDALVYHRYRATMKQYPARQVYFSQRNIEFVYWKNMPTALMLRYLPQRLMYELGAAVYFTRLGLGGTFLKAKYHALCQLRAVLEKRHYIQSRRSISNAQLRVLLKRNHLGPKFRKLRDAFRKSIDTPVHQSVPS